MTEMMQALTKAMSDRSKWPVRVACQRPKSPAALQLPLPCNHDECRAAYWRQYDQMIVRLTARGMAPRPKSRRTA